MLQALRALAQASVFNRLTGGITVAYNFDIQMIDSTFFQAR